jgi:pimeloyl-ACP methyl ester carboxylesterase
MTCRDVSSYADLTADDGVKLYYEETGAGTPIVFAHEFAGDHRSGSRRCALLAPLPLHHLQRARLSAVDVLRRSTAIHSSAAATTS